MTKKTKRGYDAPKVKVVKFVVEQGFAGSGDTPSASSNNTFMVTDRNQLTRTGDDRYRWNVASTEGNDAWF